MFIDLGRWSACFQQEMGGVAMWRLLLPLAGDSGSENIRFFRSKMCVRAFDLDLTLMSPPGTLQRRSPQVDGQHGGLKANGRGRRKECLAMWGRGVWGKGMRDGKNRKGQTNSGNTAIWRKRGRLRQRERERKNGAETSNGSNPSSPSCTPESKDLIQQAQTKERDGPLWRDCGTPALWENRNKTDTPTGWAGKMELLVSDNLQ